jgi:hypothetical protein
MLGEGVLRDCRCWRFSPRNATRGSYGTAVTKGSPLPILGEGLGVRATQYSVLSTPHAGLGAALRRAGVSARITRTTTTPKTATEIGAPMWSTSTPIGSEASGDSDHVIM